ncbi:MAG TPA: phage baseplate assembly protein V [Candidatus Binataceae bacterium]|nr:phage baseplate assembly protein V [Candidatus Binataceae bacterium]
MRSSRDNPHAHPGYMGFRVGLVKQLDPANAKVRVVFPDYDQLLSFWLPVVVMKSQNDKAYWLPDLGEQVICLMDRRDEAGCVLGAIYSSVDVPPVTSPDKWHVTFKDGASVEYDRASHVLDLKFSDGAEITYDAVAHLLTLSAPDGDIKFTTSDYDTSLNQIISIYNGHTHPDPQGGNTGAPSQVIP